MQCTEEIHRETTQVFLSRLKISSSLYGDSLATLRFGKRCRTGSSRTLKRSCFLISVHRAVGCGSWIRGRQDRDTASQGTKTRPEQRGLLLLNYVEPRRSWCGTMSDDENGTTSSPSLVCLRSADFYGASATPSIFLRTGRIILYFSRGRLCRWSG